MLVVSLCVLCCHVNGSVCFVCCVFDSVCELFGVFCKLCPVCFLVFGKGLSVLL